MGEIEFVWIGDGANRKLLTAKNIRITGWLDNKEVHDEVEAADLYFSTSLYEGLSFGVLEALSLKKPVLLSNCTGNTDVVKKGINGDLFNNGDDAILKILQFYTNRDMLHVMGAYSEEICRAEFDVNRNFKAYRELYSGSVLNEANSAKWSFGY